ncbi:CocE/NonD family hydrolase [Mesorhizobium sp. BR1-1-9]|uniref:CocE/NonD family hydrolase n=1 Tax=unclassified Mesorhizobium TaxID=325217 RepID=UPI001CD0DB54|nr:MULTISPECIES: CocE/NonD family hydrolase [unclassified Mesorhizobium]MBZ9870294.1 CocE/NonD family hydrolase [Mesorhizobium sp. BR1-1-9]MBZ9942255.1 CocE/NonD family hydrolase [Mesorhizobium sp. BR1-1-13]
MVRTKFPFALETVDPYWIVLADGTRIAATVWRPRTDAKVPVVVEMVPYRRRDGTVARDIDIHPWLAGHGIACARIDIRGSGDSDGDLADEYLPREQEDACEIIAHLAAQSWCNGNVGMTGISWGGFNALQVAARRPPALKAIIANCATDDRYADDIHYMGGALLTEQEMWSNFMLVKKAMAPDPQIVGDAWRAMWISRLEATRSLSEIWLAHQRRDGYWRQGSVCEDHAAIDCAVMAVCGWEDSYSNFVPRLLEHLPGPKLGIVGPWSHAYPCRGAPGPLIGYLQEALRWWRHWLCAEDTGIMDEPLYRVWITGEERPQPFYLPDHAGSWAAEDQWPSPRVERRVLHLNAAGLSGQPAPGATLSVCSPATAGRDCGRWGGYGGSCPDMPIDQRREDGLALCFDTLPLEDDLTLLGAPELDLLVSVDQPHVNLAARLCDVYPDGTSALMTYGVLNLSHRDSHEHPTPCPIGTPFRVKLKLNDFARAIPEGHRVRLALANQHWPILWPQPKLSVLSVSSGDSKLVLPVRPPSPRDRDARFEPAETAPPVPTSTLNEGFDRRIVTEDVGSSLQIIALTSDHGSRRYVDRAITVSSANSDTMSISSGDPLSAKLVTEYRWAIASADADTEARAVTELTADETHFDLSWRLEARERGKLVHSASATRRIRRDFA